VKIVVQPFSQERTAMNTFSRCGAIVILLFCLPIVASSQITGQIGARPSKSKRANIELPIARPNNVEPAALDSGLTYFDPTARTHVWPLIANYGSLIMAGLSERFTMSSDVAYIDSVMIGFDAIDDTVVVLLAPDSIFSTPEGDFHLINIVDPNAPVYWGTRIAPPALRGPSRKMLRFPHVQVPKDFHVLISSNLVSPSALMIGVTGDSENVRARSTEGSRSGFYYVLTADQHFYTAILDSNFYSLHNAEPLYSNLDVTVFSSTDPANATTEPIAYGLLDLLATGLESGVPASESAHDDSYLYPNPCSNLVTVTKEGVESIELYDVLGRNVMSHNGPGSIEVKELPNGRYLAVLHNGGQTITQNLIVHHE
jgi:hypothetical protein